MVAIQLTCCLAFHIAVYGDITAENLRLGKV